MVVLREEPGDMPNIAGLTSVGKKGSSVIDIGELTNEYETIPQNQEPKRQKRPNPTIPKGKKCGPGRPRRSAYLKAKALS